MDLDPHPPNLALQRHLEAHAEPAHSAFSRDDPHADGWELHCHPDLRERFLAAADGLPATHRHVRGVPVLIHPNGIACAVARGTSQVLLRVPPAGRADLPPPRHATPDLDSDWVAVDPWLDLPDPEPLRRLAQWLARALAHAATLRRSGASDGSAAPGPDAP